MVAIRRFGWPWRKFRSWWIY